MSKPEMRQGRKWRMFLLDLLYPNRCPCCHKLITWDAYLCTDCQETMAKETNSFCSGCGKPVSQCMCEENLFYNHAEVVTTYADVGKSGVLSMKTAESLQFGWFCGAILGKRIVQDAQLNAYDLIVPVPMAKKKQRRRYCNPAAVLAKEISAVTRIPMRTDILYDDGTGVQQHMLSEKERQNNVAHFKVKPTSLKGYRVILCDDVLTTGSTMQRCAALLKSQGAESVAVAVATSSVLRTTF